VHPSPISYENEVVKMEVKGGYVTCKIDTLYSFTSIKIDDVFGHSDSDAELYSMHINGDDMHSVRMIFFCGGYEPESTEAVSIARILLCRCGITYSIQIESPSTHYIYIDGHSTKLTVIDSSIQLKTVRYKFRTFLRQLVDAAQSICVEYETQTRQKKHAH
jgi:hypothetical protein